MKTVGTPVPPDVSDAPVPSFPRSLVPFPCGLIQPPERFRFSADALLLAAFAAQSFWGEQGMQRAQSRKEVLFVDLGSGCGVVAFALLLTGGSGAQGVGIEQDAALVEAARVNARNLGLQERFQVVEGRVENPALMPGGRAHVVLANPPWRVRGTGRLPETEHRTQALFGTPETLGLFARAAVRLVRPGGFFFSVVGASRLVDQLEALRESGFGVGRVRCVHARAGASATLALIEARARVKDRVRVEHPLLLHKKAEAFTTEALAFCPFLGKP